MSMQYVDLPMYYISLKFDPDNPGNGTITSTPDLFETCPKCDGRACLYECDGSHLGEVQTEDEVRGRIENNASVDAILSMILAHAAAGIDVKTPAYLEGIETAFDAVSNQ